MQSQEASLGNAQRANVSTQQVNMQETQHSSLTNTDQHTASVQQKRSRHSFLRGAQMDANGMYTSPVTHRRFGRLFNTDVKASETDGMIITDHSDMPRPVEEPVKKVYKKKTSQKKVVEDEDEEEPASTTVAAHIVAPIVGPIVAPIVGPIVAPIVGPIVAPAAFSETAPMPSYTPVATPSNAPVSTPMVIPATATVPHTRRVPDGVVTMETLFNTSQVKQDMTMNSATLKQELTTNSAPALNCQKDAAQTCSCPSSSTGCTIHKVNTKKSTTMDNKLHKEFIPNGMQNLIDRSCIQDVKTLYHFMNVISNAMHTAMNAMDSTRLLAVIEILESISAHALVTYETLKENECKQPEQARVMHESHDPVKNSPGKVAEAILSLGSEDKTIICNWLSYLEYILRNPGTFKLPITDTVQLVRDRLCSVVDKVVKSDAFNESCVVDIPSELKAIGEASMARVPVNNSVSMRTSPTNAKTARLKAEQLARDAPKNQDDDINSSSDDDMHKKFLQETKRAEKAIEKVHRSIINALNRASSLHGKERDKAMDQVSNALEQTANNLPQPHIHTCEVPVAPKSRPYMCEAPAAPKSRSYTCEAPTASNSQARPSTSTDHVLSDVLATSYKWSDVDGVRTITVNIRNSLDIVNERLMKDITTCVKTLIHTGYQRAYAAYNDNAIPPKYKEVMKEFTYKVKVEGEDTLIVYTMPKFIYAPTDDNLKAMNSLTRAVMKKRLNMQ